MSASVKEFLQNGRNLHFEIKKLKQLQQKKLDEATAHGIDYSKARASQSFGNSVETKYMEYADFSSMLEQRIYELEDYRARMLMLINSYPDSTGRRLLLMRYIECLSWEKISEELSYDVRWVQRLHGKILVKLQNRP